MGVAETPGAAQKNAARGARGRSQQPGLAIGQAGLPQLSNPLWRVSRLRRAFRHFFWAGTCPMVRGVLSIAVIAGNRAIGPSDHREIGSSVHPIIGELSAVFTRSKAKQSMARPMTR